MSEVECSGCCPTGYHCGGCDCMPLDDALAVTVEAWDLMEGGDTDA